MTVIAGKRRTWARRWMWIALGAVAVALIVMVLRPTPLEVDIAVAERGSMQVTLDEEGETRVRDRYMISAPVSGRVLRIELEPGDPIIADETVLAVFQPAPHSMDATIQSLLFSP